MYNNELSLIDYCKIIWRKKISIIGLTLLIGIISAVISLFLPKWYRGTAVLLPPNSTESSLGAMSILGNLGMGGMFGGNENLFRYLAILKSRTLKEALIDKFNLQEKYGTDNVGATIKKINKNLSFKVGDENQITIAVLDKDQDMVADMANYIVRSLDSINISLTSKNAKNNREFIEKRYNQVIDSLNLVSQNLTEFMQENRLLSISDQTAVGIERAAALQAEIMAAEVELEVAMNLTSIDNPAIISKQVKLASLKNKYDEFTKNNELIPNFQNIPHLEMELIKMKRQIEYYTKLIEFLGPQYETSKIEEAKDIPTVQILDYAVRPGRKYKPKRSLIVIISCFVSFILFSSFYILKDTTILKS